MKLELCLTSGNCSPLLIFRDKPKICLSYKSRVWVVGSIGRIYPTITSNEASLWIVDNNILVSGRSRCAVFVGYGNKDGINTSFGVGICIDAFITINAARKVSLYFTIINTTGVWLVVHPSRIVKGDTQGYFCIYLN